MRTHGGWKPNSAIRQPVILLIQNLTFYDFESGIPLPERCGVPVGDEVRFESK